MNKEKGIYDVNVSILIDNGHRMGVLGWDNAVDIVVRQTRETGVGIIVMKCLIKRGGVEIAVGKQENTVGMFYYLSVCIVGEIGVPTWCLSKDAWNEKTYQESGAEK